MSDAGIRVVCESVVSVAGLILVGFIMWRLFRD